MARITAWYRPWRGPRSKVAVVSGSTPATSWSNGTPSLSSRSRQACVDGSSSPEVSSSTRRSTVRGSASRPPVRRPPIAVGSASARGPATGSGDTVRAALPGAVVPYGRTSCRAPPEIDEGIGEIVLRRPVAVRRPPDRCWPAAGPGLRIGRWAAPPRGCSRESPRCRRGARPAPASRWPCRCRRCRAGRARWRRRCTPPPRPRRRATSTKSRKASSGPTDSGWPSATERSRCASRPGRVLGGAPAPTGLKTRSTLALRPAVGRQRQHRPGAGEFADAVCPEWSGVVGLVDRPVGGGGAVLGRRTEVDVQRRRCGRRHRRQQPDGRDDVAVGQLFGSARHHPGSSSRPRRGG